MRFTYRQITNNYMKYRGKWEIETISSPHKNSLLSLTTINFNTIYIMFLDVILLKGSCIFTIQEIFCLKIILYGLN